ncbi:hypothetical protein Mia14_0505 [Candidatus Mancarchaeum acidiphilum]|uniref:Uncharacterized protein n=1 Tax=Candidatus Mancarchaeum acidiphilum TaxID=1920749 RepID=A0A218NMV7_9ARCH|nr:hypothetical protein [Candidatus Mancarchaeum acidiphilum]ASI13818.1 hypothetical protein Mia14_0505 [Candidatus Mancarchaeum acidiphilum]
MDKTKDKNFGAERLSSMTGEEFDSKFSKFFMEEKDSLDKNEIGKYKHDGSMNITEGPSKKSVKKLLGMRLMDPVNRPISKLELPSSKGVSLNRSLEALVSSIENAPIVILKEDRLNEAQLTLENNQIFYGNAAKGIIEEAKDINRDILSKIAFGKRYAELSDSEKYGLIINRLFRMHTHGFKMELTVPRFEAYGNLVDLAAKTNPMFISIHENRSLNSPVLDAVIDRFEGRGKIEDFLKALATEFYKELKARNEKPINDRKDKIKSVVNFITGGSLSGGIGAELYLPGNGSDVSIELEKLAADAYYPRFVLVHEGTGDKFPVLYYIAGTVSGEKMIKDILNLAIERKERERKMLRE